MVEPNVKEGKGGLRDLHSLLIVKYVHRAKTIGELVDLGLFTKEEQDFPKGRDIFIMYAVIFTLREPCKRSFKLDLSKLRPP